MKRIISFLLVVTMLFTTCAITVGAARQEEFISEVALVYEDSVEEAKKAIEGTDWKLFEQDLNANADYMIDDGVYLIYKTSTNVEDAITDLRVMDMYGGYSTSNYEKQLEESRETYTTLIKHLRVAAAEFAELYKEEDAMAQIAYRQMSYYKDNVTEGGTETDMFMGDFFLHMPTDDRVVQVLLEGNAIVVSNLITLLAIGISGENSASLATKVAENATIQDTLTDREYYNDAVKISKALSTIRAKILRYDALSAEYNLADEEFTEEEMLFMAEYGSLVLLLDEIRLGERTLLSIIRNGTYPIQDLYPLVAAFSDGQKALIELGQIETVLMYNSSTKPVSEMNALLDEAEKQLTDENGTFHPIDVYVGVDRSIFRGTFAMTNSAERQQALTGETWDIYKAAQPTALLIVSYVIAGLGATAACAGVGILSVALFYKITEVVTFLLASSSLNLIQSSVWGLAYDTYMAMWSGTAYGLFAVAAAFAIVAAGIASIAIWYNYYNPNYTEIPNTMIDVREGELGDQYVKYTAAKVFEDGKLSEKNADFNAYQGKEWNALYYTKDANAGNCLTPNFVFSDSSSAVTRRHQGVSMFGETNAFNLNSHVYSSNAKGAYLTVRYSTAKKAAADMPNVVGSMFSEGAFYAIAALAGVCVGAGGTILLQNSKKKKKKEVADNA